MAHEELRVECDIDNKDALLFGYTEDSTTIYIESWAKKGLLNTDLFLTATDAENLIEFLQQHIPRMKEAYARELIGAA